MLERLKSIKDFAKLARQPNLHLRYRVRETRVRARARAPTLLEFKDDDPRGET